MGNINIENYLRYWDNLSEQGKRQVFSILVNYLYNNDFYGWDYIKKEVEEFNRLYPKNY